jgi:outer membrane protein assembly complex protein YaeT
MNFLATTFARNCRRALAAGLLVALGVSHLVAEVKIGVSGMGWLHDRDMRISLARLMGATKASTLDANALEDGAVILNSALVDDGFQNATIDLEVTPEQGTPHRVRFDPTFANPIPRSLRAKAVTFHVVPGIRSRITDVVLAGLTVLSEKQGRGYFITDESLFNVAAANAYSNSRVNRSEAALLDELKRRGYNEASVNAAVEHMDPATGAVILRAEVHEGPRWVVHEVAIAGPSVPDVTLPDAKSWQGQSWSATVEQDIREAVRLAYYKGGYPDVTMTVKVDAAAARNRVRATTVHVAVTSGQRVTVGQVKFEGDKVTRERVLRRRVALKSGDPLNPIELEHARYRISRLGVFESVDLTYDPPGGTTRDPVFSLREGPRYETNLLFGYASYDEFRAGVEYRQMNIFGLAHQSRLLLIQSVKSTTGEYRYTVPELFGENIDGTAKLYGLERQEIAFLRQEFGGNVSLRRPIRRLHGDATLGYTFEALRTRRNTLSTDVAEPAQLNAAHIDFGLTTNRLDNELRPRSGYHATLQTEVASPNLGGVAQYQRIDLSGAYHSPWGSGRWIHVGMSHGLITTFGADSDRTLPVNKRFFPGGDNSIRGYRLGEAAPRDPTGHFIGAKSYLLVNLELEQALAGNWSLVAFGDALGTATALRDYPFRERLYSVGLGIRYQTIVGPVRLEYGRNVNPRPADPSGTLQISIGYPF